MDNALTIKANQSTTNYAGFFGAIGEEENDTTKYRHKLLNNSVTFGTPVTCEYDLTCQTLTASAIW